MCIIDSQNSLDKSAAESLEPLRYSDVEQSEGYIKPWLHCPTELYSIVVDAGYATGWSYLEAK